MRVETARGLVGVDVDGIVEVVDTGLLAPGFRLRELGVRGGEIPAAGAEVAENGGVVVRGRGGGRGGAVELVLREEGFEGGKRGGLGLGEVAEVAVRITVVEGTLDGGLGAGG